MIKHCRHSVALPNRTLAASTGDVVWEYFVPAQDDYELAKKRMRSREFWLEGVRAKIVCTADVANRWLVLRVLEAPVPAGGAIDGRCIIEIPLNLVAIVASQVVCLSASNSGANQAQAGVVQIISATIPKLFLEETNVIQLFANASAGVSDVYTAMSLSYLEAYES